MVCRLDDIYGPFQYVYSQENSSGSIRHRGFVQLQRQLESGAEVTAGLVDEYSDLLGEALDSADLEPATIRTTEMGLVKQMAGNQRL